MKPIESIKEALKKSENYKSYKNSIQNLFNEGKTTGENQSEAYLHYTELNLQRTKRWDKIGKINPEAVSKISEINTRQIWLVITEAWCGDAGHALPFINKLAELNPKIDLQIVLRDENEELMNNFLTNGGKSIPKLISYSPEDQKVLFTWGPRPDEAMQMVLKEKTAKGKLDSKFIEQLQKWFNKDKGNQTLKDIVDLVSKT
ncbi:MAG: thioredoxin family protein [Flavobacteriaceae bacterium]|nr:thioredoxin family protein [Flavobacteriaceae bacterium]